MTRARKLPRYNSPAPKTAHDVRRLTVCDACGGFGDKADMVRPEALLHGRCFIALFGLPAFLALPRKQTDQCTLGDIGSTAMAALLNRDTGKRRVTPRRAAPG